MMMTMMTMTRMEKIRNGNSMGTHFRWLACKVVALDRIKCAVEVSSSATSIINCDMSSYDDERR
jgi:hypothetical protein